MLVQFAGPSHSREKPALSLPNGGNQLGKPLEMKQRSNESMATSQDRTPAPNCRFWRPFLVEPWTCKKAPLCLLPAWFRLESIGLSPLSSCTFPLSTSNYMCFQQHSRFASDFSTAVLCFQ